MAKKISKEKAKEILEQARLQMRGADMRLKINMQDVRSFVASKQYAKDSNSK